MASTGIPSTDSAGDLTGELGTRLAARTLELIDIPSESGAERNIAKHVLRVLRAGGVPARDAGDSCVLAAAATHSEPGRPSERPFVLLAGHLDTVPAQENRPGALTSEHVEGLGAADMKGGVAVMLELALARSQLALAWSPSVGDCAHSPSAGPPRTSRGVDVGYVLFAREELPAAQGSLGPLLAREAGLRSADLAIVLEPTANRVQAGCLGNLDAAWTFRGRAGHSARPWLAENAIDRAARGVLALHAIEPSRRTLDGLDFTQVVSVTTLHSGLARNVIPAAATANVNFRYPPDVTPEQAERTLRAWCEPHGEIEVLCNTHGARPPGESQLLARLLGASGGSVQAKQAWTPVAEFDAVGVPAVNLGPGDPTLAHRPDERVATAALMRTHTILEAFLCA